MAWFYILSVAGSNGKVKNLNFALQSADYATAVVDAATVYAALQAVSDVNIQKGRLSEVTEYPVSLPSNVDTAIIATMSGKINGSTKSVVVKFPAPKDTLRLGSTGDEYNELDLSAAAIEAYWDLFNVGAEAYISDGENTAASPLRSQIISLQSRNP